MVRPVGRPRYDAKQKLIAAMRELMAERGYAATSPKMVLERAKLGQGSLYYHFAGKEELAIETVAALMHRSLTILTNELDGESEPDESTPDSDTVHEDTRSGPERVEATLAELFEKKEGRALVRLLADPTATQPGPLADGIAVWVEALRLLLVEAFRNEKQHRLAAPAGRGADSATPATAEQAGAILASALGRSLLLIGTGRHLPQ